MSYRYHGKADVNPVSPRAFAVCDRCGGLYNHENLQWQYQFAGVSLLNLQLLVCRECLDDPQPQLTATILPPDPDPVMNARPAYYALAEVDYWTVEGGDHVLMENSDNLIVTDQASENFSD